MKLVGLQKLHDFTKRHADARSAIAAWIVEVTNATWNSPIDVKARYVHASILNNNKVIFNIKGNDYRLEVQVSYKNQVVTIKRIGTHREYSNWSF